jgi:hypothetical protein
VASEIQLRPGVVFRAGASGAGSIEFPKGRRFDNVTFCGALRGKTNESGAPGQVNVLSAVYPTSSDRQAKWEQLPVLVVVPAETQYLKGSWITLFSLFFLPSLIADECEIDPGRTVFLTMHGSVEVGESDEILAGSPSLPSVDPGRWISLDAPAVARLVGWIHCPAGEQPNAVVNASCFSSTPRGKESTTFNEELAALLAKDCVTVFGPPHGGIVTSAYWEGQWRQFSQRLEDEKAIRDVPIKFQRITPAARRRRRRARVARSGSTAAGSLVITNDYALAVGVCTFSADFAEPRVQDFDRALME